MELDETINKIIYLFETSNKSNRSMLIEMGLSPTAYNEWKSGRSKPTINALKKIAQYFNTSVDYLTGYKPEKKPSYPEILIPEKNNWDYSFWYNEKINKTLNNFCLLIDDINKIKLILKNETLIKDMNNHIKETTFYLIKMLIVTSGLTEFDYNKDVELILNNGTIGYMELKEKYGIDNNDMTVKTMGRVIENKNKNNNS